MNTDRTHSEPRGGTGDYASQDLALKIEKMALEREMLAHEREKLSLERDKWKSEREWMDRRRAVFSPLLGVFVAVFACVIGIGIGYMIPREPTISLDATRVDPAMFQLQKGGEKQEAVAYLLMVR